MKKNDKIFVTCHEEMVGSAILRHLEEEGFQCKTLFGSLPTQHQVFKFLGYQYGQFPASEYVGENGLHFGIHQYLNDEDLPYISDTLKGYFM